MYSINKNKKTASVFIPHYGCKNDCVFCNQVKISGMDRKFDYESMKSGIIRDILSMKDGVDIEIAFFGGSFTAIDADVQENCLKIANDIRLKYGKDIQIKLSTRPDAIDETVINRLIKYRVNTVELGVQSMDDEVLKASNRGHDSKSVYIASDMIKKANINLGHQIMVGLPMDSQQKLRDTMKKVIDIGPDIARIYPVLVIKDTELERMYREGQYKPLSLEEAVKLSAFVYEQFENAGINVIRTGLQATENIDLGKDVVAGPFHSAFGELVISYIFKTKLENWIRQDHIRGRKLKIKANKNYISKIIGNKKSNKVYFKKNYDVDLSIQAVDEDGIKVENGEIILPINL